MGLNFSFWKCSFWWDLGGDGPRLLALYRRVWGLEAHCSCKNDPNGNTRRLLLIGGVLCQALIPSSWLLVSPTIREKQKPSGLQQQVLITASLFIANMSRDPYRTLTEGVERLTGPLTQLLQKHDEFVLQNVQTMNTMGSLPRFNADLKAATERDTREMKESAKQEKDGNGRGP